MLRATLAAPIPVSMPYENAAVLPLGLSIAACALFRRDCLALEHPSVSPRATGQTVLVWGGSTSHGLRHIQDALDAQRKGVSAAKIVVSLDAG